MIFDPPVLKNLNRFKLLLFLIFSLFSAPPRQNASRNFAQPEKRPRATISRNLAHFLTN